MQTRNLRTLAWPSCWTLLFRDRNQQTETVEKHGSHCRIPGSNLDGIRRSFPALCKSDADAVLAQVDRLLLSFLEV